MKTDAVTIEDLRRSVIAVPPLARTASLDIEANENRRLVRHLEAGSVTTLMYGGNANLYNLPVSETSPLAEMLQKIVAPGSWVIPSVGPDYGKALDQLRILADFDFPTAMVLPAQSASCKAGVATGLRKLADAYGRSLIAYAKFEDYASARDLAALIEDGVVCAVKYAVVREEPAQDAYLAELVDAAGPDRIISGIGERPVIDHFTHFGLRAFTSGSVCVAPSLSAAMLRALNAGRIDRAGALRAQVLALEDLRDEHSPMRVLHEAVRLAGISQTGPMLPFFQSIEDAGLLTKIEQAATALLAADRGEARQAAE